MNDAATSSSYVSTTRVVAFSSLAHAGVPFIYQIPPAEDGSIPDALFYWGGDEYRGPVEDSLFASDWMKAQGLPYHINIESDQHPMTRLG